MRWLIRRVNLLVILAAMLVAGGLIVLILLALFLSPVPTPAALNPGAALTIIAAPTLTLTPTRVLETPTSTAPPSVDGISIGNYVQISGTEGSGLRLRSGPGTSNPPRFLGMDAEVFQVKDGPKESDGFTWWYLEAPYDSARSGWAASKFLAVVNNPTPTATP
jgi:hypothetical protein